MLGSSLFSALPSCDTLHLEPGQSHLQQNAHFDNESALVLLVMKGVLGIPSPVVQTSLVSLILWREAEENGKEQRVHPGLQSCVAHPQLQPGSCGSSCPKGAVGFLSNQ